ncbi:MAG: caspase family protein [Pirellulales bacterium]|nr:caspase family protein [Pirellulales bacterium]
MIILAVHGLGGWEQEFTWQDAWRKDFTKAVQGAGGSTPPRVEFVSYDDIFANSDLGLVETARALALLLGSGLGLGRPRALQDSLRTYWQWYAGMVVQWVGDEDLRRKTRKRLFDAIQSVQPDVIAGHSLGSLISYDTCTHPDTKACIDGRTLITYGSQVGNPFVVGQFLAGRIQPLQGDAFWYHLYNRYDDVFTAPINLTAANFLQVDTPFDIEGWADHASGPYVTHPNAVRSVWATIAGGPKMRRAVLPGGTPAVAARSMRREPRRKALLVGINEYPTPENCLEGCVNDAFLTSSVLQEVGFKPEEIRLLLNERATTAGILERFGWLLEDAQPGDQLFFFYSGHGGVLPSYNAESVVDSLHECLVPHDYDGTEAHCITDAKLFQLYSQIPYETVFVMALDCCHSGGMTRGNGPRVRGLDPPDDIRHRMLRWDPIRQLWVARKLPQINQDLGGTEKQRREFAGDSGAVLRLGTAMPLRTLKQADYDQVRQERDHKGPYMPMILLACAADEFALEYVHGSVSYGSFTYVMTKTLRESYRVQGKTLTFRELVDATKKELVEIGVNQTPDISGPTALLKETIPFPVADAGRGKRGRGSAPRSKSKPATKPVRGIRRKRRK